MESKVGKRSPSNHSHLSVHRKTYFLFLKSFISSEIMFFNKNQLELWFHPVSYPQVINYFNRRLLGKPESSGL